MQRAKIVQQRRGVTRLFVCFFLAVLCPGSAASAREAAELPYDLRLDLSLTLAAATLWGTGYLIEDHLVPAHCRWCNDNAFDARAREALLWSEPKLAGALSDVGALVAAPALAFAGLASAAYDAGAMKYFYQDALFVFEAVSIAALLNEVVKFSVARERPYVHYDAFDGHPTGSYERTSFYSAHTNRAFALASAAGMVASMRGYRLAPLIWTLGMITATVVGYARVAGDYHYLSDVLVGGALGSLVGAGLPWLMHRPGQKRVQLSVSASGVALIFRN